MDATLLVALVLIAVVGGAVCWGIAQLVYVIFKRKD